eukprot:TRINITY_DN2742_c0_g1_i1.p1 TRINITY_DN2742_c0_g1~~TRINITY_DN2742_c0_g1_i1.p1  ORF type:complete len:419 (+),score=64.82 TRINITY_DN2742_c0_g1_i1:565-1821(+)
MNLDLMDLANYPIVVSNILDPNNELPLVKSRVVIEVGGVKVGFCGILTEDMEYLVSSPSKLGNISVLPAVISAQKCHEFLVGDGATVFVVLIHEGAKRDANHVISGGKLAEFASNIEGFDLILGDHTDVKYLDRINGALVVENYSKGRSFSRVTLNISEQGSVINSTCEFIEPDTTKVVPNLAALSFMEPYNILVSQRLDTKIALSMQSLSRDERYSKEVALANLVADSFRWRLKTDFAMINSGNLRDSIPGQRYIARDKKLQRDTSPYDITRGDCMSVMPFGNKLVYRKISGFQIYNLVEFAVSRTEEIIIHAHFSGLHYSYDPKMPQGNRVINITYPTGEKISNSSLEYFTIAVSSFLNSGGDEFPLDGTGETLNDVIDTETFCDYLQYMNVIPPEDQLMYGRIVAVNISNYVNKL